MNTLPAAAGSDPVIEHGDALDWLAAREPGTATAVIYDPPYAVGSPVRGREDGAAGSVFGPLSFLSRTMSLCARALRPGGIVVIFTDYRRMADMGYIASTVGLPPASCVAWVRNRPGTGGLFRDVVGPGPHRLPRRPGHGRPGGHQERDRRRLPGPAPPPLREAGGGL